MEGSRGFEPSLQCSSAKVWKDGLRYTSLGHVQRYVCRSCGYRFSDPESRNALQNIVQPIYIHSTMLKAWENVTVTCDINVTKCCFVIISTFLRYFFYFLSVEKEPER